MTEIELRSLAPEYSEIHHKTYVSRLNAAVIDPRNRNIALTGRYGAGKSSILDHFIAEQEKPDGNEAQKGKKKGNRNASPRKKVLRISISTLGPDDDGELTNRIQKELVKQLVYRAKPGELRTSRFARARELTRWRAAIEAFVLAIVIVCMLWLFGLRPMKDALGTDDFLLPMFAFLVLTFAILWGLRWVLGRRTVSQFSTGGASIAFEEKTDSFFDKYLDELVAFFEATEPDIVVFEDLDRFDDPQIFDSLRELNTLVNTSAHWRGRSNEPLRFIYAIKDSLFEKLGDEQLDKDAAGKPSRDDGNNAASVQSAQSAPTVSSTAARRAKENDPVSEAVERANRTKFFEIVIPVVPFLSHSNARDLFLEELNKLGLPRDTVISRGLIDIVARHTTDMRLMINIGNEFVVYSERLLWIDEASIAPGITPDRLFALVVYKNFHLADFESLPHRGSALDTLEQERRDLVDAAIRGLQHERASLVGGVTRRREQQEMAKSLGLRLQVLLDSTGVTLGSAKAGDSSLDPKAKSEPAFWQSIAQSGTVEMTFNHRSGHRDSAVLGGPNLRALFPEAADADSWADSSSQADSARVAEIDEETAALRGAGFKQLVDDDRYQNDARSFGTIVDQTLQSQLGRDLVKQGYLDRYYAEYATVFYGKFLGVDVANFFRNSVWPNDMDIQFLFTTEGGVANVLEQAPAGFLQTRSALNVDIVDYLLESNSSSTSDLVAFLAQPHNKHAREFLRTYFNAPSSHSADLASRLAKHPWPQLFSFIASKGTIDADETSVKLLTAALVNSHMADSYQLDDDARALVARLHAEIPAFRKSQPGVSVDALFSILSSALPSIPSLRALSPELKDMALLERYYDMTADNIRAAELLGDSSPISIDTLANPAVWEYCESRVDEYLDVVDSDDNTVWSCADPDVLARVVNKNINDWTAEQMERFLIASSPSAALTDINSVEQTAWKAVAASSRIVANVGNIDAYSTELGVDETLAALLVGSDGNVTNILSLGKVTPEELERLVPRLLNASQVLKPAERVALASQLMASTPRTEVELSTVEATPDTLLAELLRAKLIGDNEATFAHFASASWPSIGPALRVSINASAFITPELVAGKAAELVSDGRVPAVTRRAILERLVEFAPSEGQDLLSAAAKAAREMKVPLTGQALVLVAPFVRGAEDLLWQLRANDGALGTDAVRAILGRGPGEFQGFAESSGYEFDVPESESLPVVLDRLKAAGVIQFPPGRSPKGRRKIRIA